MKLRHLSLLISLAALAGCSAFDAVQSPLSTQKSAPGTPQRACEDAAEADHSLNDQALAITDNAHPGEFSQNLATLRQQSVLLCMRQYGMARRDGVDKVKN